MRISPKKKTPIPLSLHAGGSTNSGFTFLILFFLLGAAAGAFVGSFAGDTAFVPAVWTGGAFGTSDYIKLFWDNIRFHLAAVFFATTFLGVFLLPALSALRGYFIGCTASALICGGAGFFSPFLILGLPLLVCLPCFFIMATDAFHFSSCVLASSRGNIAGSKPPRLAFHAVICLAAIALWTFTELLLLSHFTTISQI